MSSEYAGATSAFLLASAEVVVYRAHLAYSVAHARIGRVFVFLNRERVVPVSERRW